MVKYPEGGSGPAHKEVYIERNFIPWHTLAHLERYDEISDYSNDNKKYLVKDFNSDTPGVVKLHNKTDDTWGNYKIAKTNDTWKVFPIDHIFLQKDNHPRIQIDNKNYSLIYSNAGKKKRVKVYEEKFDPESGTWKHEVISPDTILQNKIKQEIGKQKETEKLLLEYLKSQAPSLDIFDVIPFYSDDKKTYRVLKFVSGEPGVVELYNQTDDTWGNYKIAKINNTWRVFPMEHHFIPQKNGYKIFSMKNKVYHLKKNSGKNFEVCEEIFDTTQGSWRFNEVQDKVLKQKIVSVFLTQGRGKDEGKTKENTNWFDLPRFGLKANDKVQYEKKDCVINDFLFYKPGCITLKDYGEKQFKIAKINGTWGAFSIDHTFAPKPYKKITAEGKNYFINSHENKTPYTLWEERFISHAGTWNLHTATISESMRKKIKDELWYFDIPKEVLFKGNAAKIEHFIEKKLGFVTLKGDGDQQFKIAKINGRWEAFIYNYNFFNKEYIRVGINNKNYFVKKNLAEEIKIYEEKFNPNSEEWVLSGVAVGDTLRNIIISKGKEILAEQVNKKSFTPTTPLTTSTPGYAGEAWGIHPGGWGGTEGIPKKSESNSYKPTISKIEPQTLQDLIAQERTMESDMQTSKQTMNTLQTKDEQIYSKNRFLIETDPEKLTPKEKEKLASILLKRLALKLEIEHFKNEKNGNESRLYIRQLLKDKPIQKNQIPIMGEETLRGLVESPSNTSNPDKTTIQPIGSDQTIIQPTASSTGTFPTEDVTHKNIQGTQQIFTQAVRFLKDITHNNKPNKKALAYFAAFLIALGLPKGVKDDSDTSFQLQKNSNILEYQKQENKKNNNIVSSESKISIPESKETPTISDIYVVKKGDRLMKILREKGYTPADVMNAIMDRSGFIEELAHQGITDPNKIYPGNEINISKLAPYLNKSRV